MTILDEIIKNHLGIINVDSNINILKELGEVELKNTLDHAL